MNDQNKKQLHECKIREAERLVKKVESPLGAKRLGEEVAEFYKKELAGKRMQ